MDAQIVRPARPGDAQALEKLSVQEYESWSRDDFLGTMGQQVARICVLEEREQVLGYAVLYFDRDGSELTQIAVDPARRREHIASQLLDALFAFLKENEIPQVMLQVRAGNAAAQALDEKYGFERVHVTKDFYRNPVEDAVLMIHRS